MRGLNDGESSIHKTNSTNPNSVSNKVIIGPRLVNNTDLQYTEHYPGEKYHHLDKTEYLASEEVSKHFKLSSSLSNVNSVESRFKLRVSLKSEKDSPYIFIGETEEALAKDNVLRFCTIILITYFFEKHQQFAFTLFTNGKKANEIEPQMCQIVHNKKTSVFFESSEDNHSNLLIEAQEVIFKSMLSSLSIRLTVKQPYNKAEKYQIFFFIENLIEKDSWMRVYTSRSYEIELSKTIELKKVSMRKDAFSRDSSDFRFVLCHAETREILGLCMYTAVISLNDYSFIQCPINAPNKHEHNVGQFDVNYQEEQYKSLDYYLKYGLKIHLIIGIDYTESNGHYTDSTSLHYRSNTKNDYEKAISICGDALGQFDSEQQFSVYGFGAYLDKKREVNHCFPINFSPSNPKIHLIENIFNVYRNSLDRVKFSGPTCFEPLLNKTGELIKEEADGKTNHYYILMILTDGNINDMKKVRDKIVAASEWPLSIVIIGIGDEDFWSMKELEGTEQVLMNEQDEEAKRSNVKFIQFNDFKANNNMDALAYEAKREIPRQVVEYYKMFNCWINDN